MKISTEIAYDQRLPVLATAVLDHESLMKRIAPGLLACSIFLGAFLGACVPHTIQIEPIHMTVDVHIHDTDKEAKPGDAASNDKD